jgi:hypothetical protein
MRDEATGNFSGYVPDLVAELASHLKFNYKIVIPEDKQYGSLVKDTGQWDGMVGDVIRLVQIEQTRNILNQNKILFFLNFSGVGASLFLLLMNVIYVRDNNAIIYWDRERILLWQD